MKYLKLEVGNYGTNCYILISDDEKNVVLIDPAFDTDKIDKIIGNRNVQNIILTHGHLDHICMSGYFREKYNSKVCIGAEETPYLKDETLYRPIPIAEEYTQCVFNADVLLSEGDIINFDNKKLYILETPGHTLGSISIFCDGLLFCGDVIFKGSYGRTDFKFGDNISIMKSIKRLLSLPPETKILPGHGPDTSVGEERQYYHF